MPILLKGLVPAVIACLGLAGPIHAVESSGGSAAERVTEVDGQIRIAPRYSTEGFNNPWPASYQHGYYQRADQTVRMFAGRANNRTTGEHEKWGYPDNIGTWFNGDRAAALAGLQTIDGEQGWTDGIDLYWCFTLKGQAAKYFYFEHDLEPAYRERMRAAMQLWTASDPRPSLEYVLNLRSEEPTVVAYAQEQLTAMFRTADEVREMADAAAAEGSDVKQRFAAHMRAIADRLPAEAPSDVADWEAWWGLIAAGDWMVFEEYERRANPNPHPQHGVGTGPVGQAWAPAVRGMRADARNTDNLRGMREVAVYLFAEETENEIIRLLYKDKLRRTAVAFFTIGNGEWDSETYLAHTAAAYHNLYAFARDPEVRNYAKAILDFVYTASAVKYWRGCWGGPVKRDYGNRGPMATSAKLGWLYFGDSPTAPGKGPAENLFAIMSDYRPPAAVVALAQRDFDRPHEMFNSHPGYSNWLPGAGDDPEFRETLYYGDSFMFGTLAQGNGYNLNGFKLLTYNSEHGADYVIATSGNPKKLVTGTAGGDRIGQYRNLAVFLNGNGGVPVHLDIPASAILEQEGSVTFIQLEQTWIAYFPINLSDVGQRQGGKRRNARLWSGTGAGNNMACGFAIEVGDAATHSDYAGFKQAVLEGAGVTITGRRAELTASDGRTLAVTIAGNGLPVVERDGVVHDWDAVHRGLYLPADGNVDAAPVHMPWHAGTLAVRAGGHTFSATMTPDGAYTWEHSVAED